MLRWCVTGNYRLQGHVPDHTWPFGSNALFLVWILLVFTLRSCTLNFLSMLTVGNENNYGQFPWRNCYCQLGNHNYGAGLKNGTQDSYKNFSHFVLWKLCKCKSFYSGKLITINILTRRELKGVSHTSHL